MLKAKTLRSYVKHVSAFALLLAYPAVKDNGPPFCTSTPGHLFAFVYEEKTPLRQHLQGHRFQNTNAKLAFTHNTIESDHISNKHDVVEQGVACQLMLDKHFCA